jgi:hypothetical protein
MENGKSIWGRTKSYRAGSEPQVRVRGILLNCQIEQTLTDVKPIFIASGNHCGCARVIDSYFFAGVPMTVTFAK